MVLSQNLTKSGDATRGCRMLHLIIKLFQGFPPQLDGLMETSTESKQV